MAIAAEELTPEVAGEYHRITTAGGAAGKPSLDLAKSNVAGRGQNIRPKAWTNPEAGTLPYKAAALSQQQGFRWAMDPKGQLWATGHDVSRLLPTAVVGRSSILPRLIVAFFLAVMVLEVVSYMTGRYFSYDLSSPIKPVGKQDYRPLYPGQVLQNPHYDPPAANAPKGYTLPSYGTNAVPVGSIVAQQGANAPGFGV